MTNLNESERDSAPHVRGRAGADGQKLSGDKMALQTAYAARDALVGRFNAIERLRAGTHIPELYLPGDPHPIDEAWNKSLVSAGQTGRFCAYCAQRTPPVLSRHRFTECTFRQLAGRPEFSADSLAALEEEVCA